MEGSKLHKLCQEGRFEKVAVYVNSLTDKAQLQKALDSHRGIFGYTPLHEAVANGNSSILDFLISKGADVNSRANSGYTPLHLAASSGHIDCVKVLLKHSADVLARDEYTKTPKQTAYLSSKSKVVRLLKSEEIIRGALSDSRTLNDLLKLNIDDLEPDCLNRALLVATAHNNHANAGILIIKGANNISDALLVAKEKRNHAVRGLLLLIKAVMDDDIPMMLRLFGGVAESNIHEDEDFVHVQKAVCGPNRIVSTVVPIEIARWKGHSAIREELLLQTDVSYEDSSVCWHGLRLLVLELSWLRKIHWVKYLRLERNGFKSLPVEMGLHIQHVVKLELQNNELVKIPGCLLELPSLVELNVSHNLLEVIPNIEEWSHSLQVVDFSHNQLITLPSEVTVPCIWSLNLSFNLFFVVPDCICSMTSLVSLDISFNPQILSLPMEMSRLVDLQKLNLDGLKDLNDPPKSLQKSAQDCIHYLGCKLRGVKPFYRMKLMIVGKPQRGKTTLVQCLNGIKCDTETTVGIEVTEWQYKSTKAKEIFHFSIWDFGGQEEYHATHQCFMTQCSLYLLLFDLTHKQHGVQELKPWINNIAVRAPHSYILIVGTHLDKLNCAEVETVPVLLLEASKLAGLYSHKLVVGDPIAVALKDPLQNIAELKEAIYAAAASYRMYPGNQPVMGQKVPSSYHTLDNWLAKLQQEAKCGSIGPIMTSETFKLYIQQMNFPDIQNDAELKLAVRFLCNVGSLLHYDDRSHSLHELYFISPQWLCQMMAKFATVKERNHYVNKGILCLSALPQILKEDQFPLAYCEQYISLLDRFEIALVLNNQYILIPSMLPEEEPECAHLPASAEHYIRYIIFNSEIPPGFWSRFLSRIMHSVACVRENLDKCFLDTLSTLSINHQTHSWMPNNPIQRARDVLPDHDNFVSISASHLTGSSSVSALSHAGSSAFSTMPPFAGLPAVLGPGLHSYDGVSYSLPLHNQAHPDVSHVILEYWQSGLFFQDPKLMFVVKPLLKSGHMAMDHNNGVLITVSRNASGQRMISCLTNLLSTLVGEWYPGLLENGNISLEQITPCYECLLAKKNNPYQFQIRDCLQLIAVNKENIECDAGHVLHFFDLVPDLVLKGIIQPKFILNAADLYYDERDTYPRSEAFTQAFRGRYKNQQVAVKKYLTEKVEDAYVKLQREATLLHADHHPCLIGMIGVCLYPVTALVLEDAPLQHLEHVLIKKQHAIHRLVIHRIASQIAAALRFLHTRGIIFRELSTGNVLIWSLSPESLCHCKITDFGVTSHLASFYSRRMKHTKGFIAPEVLRMEKLHNQHAYDHRADVFSFGMILYQMMTCYQPFQNFPTSWVETTIERGERPNIQETALKYHHLSQLMQQCWQEVPSRRPSTSQIITEVCKTSVQSILTVKTVDTHFSLSPQSCAVTLNGLGICQKSSKGSELWICCDNVSGTEIIIYTADSLKTVWRNFIKYNQVQCISVCGECVWVASTPGIGIGEVDIFSAITHTHLHTVKLQHYSVCCIACSDELIYCGTLEGYCISFSKEVHVIRHSEHPYIMSKVISEYCIDGITCTSDYVWISQRNVLHFLDYNNLTIRESVMRQVYQEASIGQLWQSSSKEIVWSAYIGGTILSAWSAEHRESKFDIDVRQHLLHSNTIAITAVTPVLDTVWVGLSSGNILVFHNQNPIISFQPYTRFVRFLTTIPCDGPCQIKQCIVLSGAKGFCENSEEPTESLATANDTGTLILWEAYNAQTTQQLRLIEENSGTFLDNHHATRVLVERGQFKDGTKLCCRETEHITTQAEDSVVIGCSNVPIQCTISRPNSLPLLR